MQKHIVFHCHDKTKGYSVDDTQKTSFGSRITVLSLTLHFPWKVLEDNREYQSTRRHATPREIDCDKDRDNLVPAEDLM